MKSHKKSLIASILAFALGISCCWMNALAIWLGGLSVFGVLINTMKGYQTHLIVLGIGLLIITIYLFFKNKNNRLGE